MSEESNEQLRDETLSRAYRQGAGAEPPPALDALILAAARREAAARPAVRSVPWWRRALAPAGVLATIVLTVSVTFMVEREQHDLLPAAVPAAAPVPERTQMSVEPIAKPAAPADAKAKGEARRSAQAPAVAAPAGALEEAIPAPQSAKQLDSSLDYRQNEAPAAASAPRRESAAADKAIRTPDEWIEDIRRLKREGRETEMRAQLAAFRLAYPDFRLPDDLKVP